jgi:hypothetical protein
MSIPELPHEYAYHPNVETTDLPVVQQSRRRISELCRMALPQPVHAWLVLARSYLDRGIQGHAAACCRLAGEDLPAGHSMRAELDLLADALFASRR